MTPDVTRTDPDGIDYGWVMQVTFLATIFVGAPIVAAASLFVTLPDWGARAEFAIRIGAFVWFLTGLAVYLYARTYRSGDAADGDEPDATADPDGE